MQFYVSSELICDQVGWSCPQYTESWVHEQSRNETQVRDTVPTKSETRASKQSARLQDTAQARRAEWANVC
jgi:hypothetical protein